MSSVNDAVFTARSFRHPETGYEQDVPRSSWVLVTLLCPIYLGLNGLWLHVLAYSAIILTLLATGPDIAPFHAAGVAFYYLSLGGVYACIIDNLIRKKYLKSGWIPIA